MTNGKRRVFINMALPFCGALALFLAPGVRFAEPVWVAGEGIVTLAIMVSLAFVVGHLLLLTPIARSEQVFSRVLRAIAVGALVSLPITLFLLITEIGVSRIVVLYELVLLFGLLIVNSLPIHRRFAFIVSLGILAVTVVASWSLREVGSDIAITYADPAITYEFANYHDLKITTQVIFDGKERAEGGSIEAVDDTRLLLVTGYGKTFFVDIDETKLSVRPLDIRIPINAEAYLEQAQNPSKYFRVTDTLLERVDGPVRKLYAAHHHFDTESRCYTLRLSETQIDLRQPVAREWVTRYASAPCVELAKVWNTNGGRLAFMRDATILMSVGDHELPSELVVDDDAHYGKVMRIDPADWTARSFTQGHRNPQGLLVEPDRIWSTEHGREGGDELNVLEYGSDYGWPFGSYGTDYGRKTLADSATGDHTRGRRPLYAWVPSIGVSNLIRVTGSVFPAWKDDLLVASLMGRSLFRVRIREDRVVTIERLMVGQRIRDLVELPRGQIVLWNGSDTIQMVESATHVFSQCYGCHTLSPENDGIGPDLSNVFGRRVAARAGYAYSEGMRRFGGDWTPERLDAFIADPAQTVPGTSMESEGVTDPAKRKEIIQFLQTRSEYEVDARR